MIRDNGFSVSSCRSGLHPNSLYFVTADCQQTVAFSPFAVCSRTPSLPDEACHPTKIRACLKTIRHKSPVPFHTVKTSGFSALPYSPATGLNKSGRTVLFGLTLPALPGKGRRTIFMTCLLPVFRLSEQGGSSRTSDTPVHRSPHRQSGRPKTSTTVEEARTRWRKVPVPSNGPG